MLQPTHSNHFEANWPSRTHWQTATCREVDCPQYLMGWVTRVEKGSKNDRYLISVMKNFSCKRMDEGELVAYYFEAGQTCFKGQARAHKKKLDRGPWLTKNKYGRNEGNLERQAMEYNRWTDEFNEEVYKANRR